MATTNPTDLTDGDILTETWTDAVTQHVVRVYSSTAARDAELTDPHVGQAVWISSNDSSEGPWVYTSAGTWRRPWNLPHGLMVNTDTTTISSTTSGTTELVVATSASWTAEANRNYEIHWTCSALGTAAGDIFTCSIRKTNAAGTQYTAKRIGITSAGQISVDVSTITTLSAGSLVLVGTFKRESGAGTLTTVGGLSNRIWVKDVGPSGAPA